MKWLFRVLNRPRYHRLLDELTDALKSGDDEEAAAIAERCVAMAVASFGERDPEVVAPLYALASAQLAAGRHDAAAQACDRAIAVAETAATEPSLDQLLEQRAAIAERAADDVAYESALRRTLAARDPSLRAAAHNRLGLFLGRAERFAEAAEQFALALAIRERSASDDLAVAEVLHNAATFRDPEADRERAASAFERALDICKRHLSREASELEARALHNLAVLRQEQLDDDEALRLFRQALAAFERDHLPADPLLRPTLARLGRLLQAKKRFDEAVPILRRAHAIAVAELGEEHAITGRIALWLGDANSHTFR